LDMVINPNRELQRRGAEYSSAELEKPAEVANETNTWNYVFDAKDLFGSSNDATQLESISNSANQFWNCLMTGTAYQVWALMYPSTVQHEILKYFPVFRDEAGLRRHIEKWGPQAYNARHYLSFPNLGGQDPVRASMHVDESPGSTTVSYTASPYDPESAIVLMIPHPDSNSSPLNYRELLLRQASDGTWWVVAINYPDNLRGKG
ncbi:MAG: hypothetical protein M9950_11245, partial [Thermomicrobiales bacterium]|nr:hypothetical protein [Thermomicrobiales bacterium]